MFPRFFVRHPAIFIEKTICHAILPEPIQEKVTDMTDKTFELAGQELRKYGLQAELPIENQLPSFEIRRRCHA